jgi:hypothetical protein
MLDQVRAATRRLHYIVPTEDAYVALTKPFLLFHGKRNPLEINEPEGIAFRTHLVVRHQVAASTQNQALITLLFLYQVVVERPLNGLDHVRRDRVEAPERSAVSARSMTGAGPGGP